MTLKDLGYNEGIEKYIQNNSLSGFTLGRVIREDRERYIVSAGEDEYDCEITGNLRFTALTRADFPAVGDWVTMIAYDSDMAIIHKVLPRETLLERQAPGKPGEKQIIASNSRSLRVRWTCSSSSSGRMNWISMTSPSPA